MSGAGRVRPAQLGVAALAAVATVLVGRWLSGGFERAYGLRAASTVAAYLALVTPPARTDSLRYDLPQLVAQARALAALPDWRDAVEVYYGTAPLLRATSAPLPPAVAGRLATTGASLWRAGAALAALPGPAAGTVVGVVRLVPRGVRPRWVGWWTAAGLAVFVAGLFPLARGGTRAPFTAIAAGALVLGVAVYADVRGAARAASDRWLLDARTLIQEAVARPSGSRLETAALGRLAAEAEVARATREIARPARRQVGGRRRAVVTARLPRWRLLELRTDPLEEGVAQWFVPLLALALLAVPGAWLLRPPTGAGPDISLPV